MNTHQYKVYTEVYQSTRAQVSDKAKAIFADALVWDMTLPYSAVYVSDELLYRYKRSGCDLVSLTVNDFPGSVSGSVKHIGLVMRQLRNLDKDFVHAKTVRDIIQAKADGKTAIIFNHQETNQLERNLDMVQIYYDLGVRHMLLAYNMKNDVGDGCAEKTDAGLSRWGVSLIKEMNRVGMLVDGTHCGYRTSMEAIEVSEAPFIFSHCAVNALYPHYRNIKDDQIKACAKTGGVIGVNGCGFFQGDMSGSVKTMFKHIDYIANLVGPQHVGIALDYLADAKPFFKSQKNDSHSWPLNNGQPHIEADFVLPEELLSLTDEMVKNGYPDNDIKGILGANFLNVAGKVWK